jgi:3-keto steroid reductase
MIPTGLLTFSHVRSSGTSLWDDSVSSMWLYKEGKPTAEQAKDAELRGDFVPIKLGSSTDFVGGEYVGVMPVLGWEVHKQEAAFLVEKCESMYTTLSTLHEPSSKALGDNMQG